MGLVDVLLPFSTRLFGPSTTNNQTGGVAIGSTRKITPRSTCIVLPVSCAVSVTMFSVLYSYLSKPQSLNTGLNINVPWAKLAKPTEPALGIARIVAVTNGATVLVSSVPVQGLGSHVVPTPLKHSPAAALH